MIMNEYRFQYLEIIEYAKSQNRIKGQGIYYENHHIIPSSMGGSDDSYNMILLTPKEHYICHSLLPQFLEGSEKVSMLCAWHWMNFATLSSMGISIKEAYNLIGPVKYAKLRSEHINNLRIGWTGENNPNWGGLSNEHKKKISLRKLSDEWIKSVGIKSRVKERETKSSQHWKDTIGKDAIDKERKTKQSLEWIESIGVPSMKKRKKTYKNIKHQQGSKNSMAQTIQCFDTNKNMIFESFGNFAELCHKHKIPHDLLKKSYQNSGRKIHFKIRSKNSKFEGWYAILI